MRVTGRLRVSSMDVDQRLKCVHWQVHYPFIGRSFVTENFDFKLLVGSGG